MAYVIEIAKIYGQGITLGMNTKTSRQIYCSKFSNKRKPQESITYYMEYRNSLRTQCIFAL